MVIPNGYAQVSHFFGGAASPHGAAVTYGVAREESLAPDLVAQGAHELFDNFWPANADSNWQLLSTLVKFGPNATGPTGEYAATVNGAISGVACPPNVAILIQKQTAFGGRTGRGRMYLPGVASQGVNDNGTIKTAELIDINGRAADFLSAMGDFGYPLALLSATASDPKPITALSCGASVATIRRRLRR